MAWFNFNGKNYIIPQAVSIIKIIKESGAPLPDFSIPLIVAEQWQGVPYSDTDTEQIRGFSQENLVRDYYGSQSEMLVAFQYFKKHGGAGCYCLGARSATKSEATLPDDAAGDSIDLTSKDWGAYTGDTAVTIVAGTADANAVVFTITPSKNVVYLTADSGTDDTIEVATTLNYKVGDKVWLTDKSTTKVQKTIKSLIEDTSITFENVIASEVTKANNARIYQEGEEEVSGELAVFSEIINWFEDECTYLSAAKATGATKVPDVMAKTCMKDIAGAIPGTSPTPTLDADGDWDKIRAMLPDKIRDFGIRLIAPIVSDHDDHLSWRDFAISQRTANKPVQIMVGGAKGDIVLAAGDSTDPTYRSYSLNNQDVILAAPGLDDEGAYLTTAPAILGLRSGNALDHNLTRDGIVASSIEKDWSTTTDRETLIKKGILGVAKDRRGFFVLKGVNSLQDNLATGGWNVDGATTWLPMQRDLIDYADYTLRTGIDNDIIGADGVTAQSLAVYIGATIDSLMATGYYLDFKIESIERDIETGEGWRVEWAAKNVGETNYVGITTHLYVG